MNRLLAGVSHALSSLIYLENQDKLKKKSSAAVLVGSLRDNTGRNLSHTGPSISIKITCNCEFECTLRPGMELAVDYKYR